MRTGRKGITIYHLIHDHEDILKRLFYSNNMAKAMIITTFIFLAPVLAIDAISDKAEKRFENGVTNLRKLFPSSTDVETRRKTLKA